MELVNRTHWGLVEAGLPTRASRLTPVMPPTKTIDAATLRAALEPVLDWLDGSAEQPPRPVLATAVRTSVRAFGQAHPGHAVELRVPPFAAVQCLSGGAHTRGTPPHVVETDPRHWLALATGRLDWTTAVRDGAVSASGYRADEVGQLLPLTGFVGD